MAASSERIVQLDNIERDIANALQYAGQAMTEMSKDKPSQKGVENHTHNFLKTLESVEKGLTNQINYLTQFSTGQPHEGSSYAAQKDLQMAFHRLEHVKSRLTELERIKNEHELLRLRQQQQSQPQQQQQQQQQLQQQSQQQQSQQIGVTAQQTGVSSQQTVASQQQQQQQPAQTLAGLL
ncbi:mediator of RNA polymerase II transcription subunit 11-like [Tubulanus polymorphus]|uniref:mediator of RNA polymerase II transcription subunit 11-like n=1 Tax=Tubulanus polymorphus TaxID=672921 RepID=UPI003DA2C689